MRGKQDSAVWLDSWLDKWKVAAWEIRKIRSEVLERAFAGVKPLPQVIKPDRGRPELTLTSQAYLARAATKPCVDCAIGRKKIATHRRLLDKIGRVYSIQSRFIVAFCGGLKLISTVSPATFQW